MIFTKFALEYEALRRHFLALFGMRQKNWRRILWSVDKLFILYQGVQFQGRQKFLALYRKIHLVLQCIGY